MASDIRSRISILGSSQKWLKVKAEPRLIQEGRRQLITSMQIRQNPLSRDSYSTNKADRESTLRKMECRKRLHRLQREKSQTFTSRLCNDNDFLWLALQGDPQT
jgi:hypothetical protein